MALGALALVVVVAAALVIPSIAVHYLAPAAREHAVALLEQRFDHVQLASLELDVDPGLHLLPRLSVVGRDLSLALPGRDPDVPFLTIHELRGELGLLGVLRTPLRVQSVSLDELVIQIPPSGSGNREPGAQTSKPPPIVVEVLVADGAVLRILPTSEDKPPLEFDLHELRVESAGLGEPMRFDSLLDNAKPPGTIRTHGRFGPLDVGNAGATPLSGEYDFEDADLSAFQGIGGILSSEGRFDGVLGKIHVRGATETPEFRLTSAGNAVPLTTAFEATVDGTNGDTLLHPVTAYLGKSRFETRGGVVSEPGMGKAVCLDAETSGGRIEDFLRLTMKSEPPLMTGDVDFDARIVIPPGDEDVVKKMLLDGEIHIDSARFPSPEVQSKVNDLSAAGRGTSQRERDNREVRERLTREGVFSNIRGHFLLRGGVMTLSHLAFSVPGATVTLEGTYGLLSEKIDFQGELRLDAKLSETTTGMKSLLFKLVDPLFRRGDTGAVIPIQITGSPEDPSYGVDFGRVLTREEVASSAEAGPRARPWPTPWEACASLPTVSSKEKPEAKN